MEAPHTTRLKLIVHYDGSAFHGWQLQPDRRTVQGELESVLSRLAASPRRVLGSGRTDAGVHATGQVATVDMPAAWAAGRLLGSLNALLPPDVWVESAEVVASDFHPRYDAIARSYSYELGLRPEAASPFHRRWCWPIADTLDRAALDEAASLVVGGHSFLAFRKAGQPERGDRCVVSCAHWLDTALGARFEITADRYLHHMVRYLVGTMVEIARGRRPADDMARLLARDAGVTTSPPAPPEGLFLRGVTYPSAAAGGTRHRATPERSPTPA